MAAVTNRKWNLFSFALLLAGGCAAVEPKDEAGDIEFVDGDEEADGYTARLRLQGTIGYGESVDSSFPRRGYNGWLLTAAAGARITIDAHGHGGTDTVLYLYGPQSGRTWSRARPIAMNDDFGGSLDSHLEVRLRSAGTYLIIVREYAGRLGSFTVSLGCTGPECRPECGADDRCPTGSTCARIWCIRAPCPSYCVPIDPTVACERDSDCVAVQTSCCPCSMGGEMRAVNAAYADAVTPSCGFDVVCPAVYNCRDERPTCVANRCEMGPALQVCGTRSAMGPLTCPAGQFCDYAPSAMCGFADAPGVCRPRPEACTAIYEPVCGCDGRTYSNRCYANSAGVSVAHEGPCGGR